MMKFVQLKKMGQHVKQYYKETGQTLYGINW
jgi:hypothetical protein